jgi:hypothetical protein
VVELVAGHVKCGVRTDEPAGSGLAAARPLLDALQIEVVAAAG